MLPLRREGCRACPLSSGTDSGVPEYSQGTVAGGHLLQVHPPAWENKLRVKYGQKNIKKNKYAIHAYTHGPVTGSGPSVKLLKYVTHLLVAS